MTTERVAAADQELDETAAGMLGRVGKARSCSLETWPLNNCILRADLLGRGDTTAEEDVSTPCVPSANLDKALDDFGCLPSEVEADDRAFLGRGPSSAVSGRSE